MPTISILTAEYAPTATYIEDTIASVLCQTLPTGWDMEWIVQEDGAIPQLESQYKKIKIVKYAANHAQNGVAMTRNLALQRVTGELVQLLDHDDMLLPGALEKLIVLFETKSIHWAIGQADDLVDGKRKPYHAALPYGAIKAGAVYEWATGNKGNWPIHCAGLMIRTDTLRAIGGWPAIITDDDLAMCAALSEVADGYNEQTVTWLYRSTPEQQSKTELWQANDQIGRLYALQRAKAVRQTGLHL